jgi:type I restriction enzyme S subunit
MTKQEGWETNSLSKVADIVMGQSPDSKYYSEDEIGLPFLQGCAEFGSRFPRPILYCSQSKKIAPKDSILFSVRAPVGRLNIAERDYIIGRGLAAISGSSVDSEYLEHYLQFEANRFQSVSQGSTFEAINSSELKNWLIEHPEAPSEQGKIGEILSTVDRVIEQTESLIAKQQRIKAGLMQDLLTRGIDEQGNLRSEETHVFKDSPLGRIPEEWDVNTLNEVTTKIADRDHTTPQYFEDGILMISPMAFCYDEGIDFDQCPRITESAHRQNSKKTNCTPGDLILHRIGAGLGQVRIVLDDHPDYSILHSLALVRPDYKRITTAFLKWSLRSFDLQHQMDMGTQSIGVPDLGLDKIASLKLKLPHYF